MKKYDKLSKGIYDNEIYQDYLDVLNNKTKKQGMNINLQVKDSIMSKITVYKNALTASHTKMIVLENQSCMPFI